MRAAVPKMESVIKTHFRMAMRSVASSVFLVSTRGPDGNAGMTATSVCSLSLDPASVLICVNRSNSFMKALEASGRFALNILSCDDEKVAKAFGSPLGRENRFVLGDWYELGGMPALKSSLSAMVCDVAGRMDYGSHRVFVGQVRQIDNHNGGAELLYCQGAFRTLQRKKTQPAF